MFDGKTLVVDLDYVHVTIMRGAFRWVMCDKRTDDPEYLRGRASGIISMARMLNLISLTEMDEYFAMLGVGGVSEQSEQK